MPSALDGAQQKWGAPKRGAVCWCLKPELPEIHPKRQFPSSNLVRRQRGWETGPALDGEFYFPFMVKALRSSTSIFSPRGLWKDWTICPFGCYKCKYDSGICNAMLTFLLEGAFSDLGFCHSLPSSLHSSGEGEGTCFHKLWPYKFLQVSAMNLNVGNSPPFCFLPAPLFLPHSPHLLLSQASWRQIPHLECLIPASFSLRKGSVSFIIISKIFCMAPTMRAHVSIISSGEKHFFLVSSGIQRIKSVWRRRDRIMVLNKYTEENSMDSSFIYLFISFFQNNFRQFSITPVYNVCAFQPFLEVVLKAEESNWALFLGDMGESPEWSILPSNS